MPPQTDSTSPSRLPASAAAWQLIARQMAPVRGVVQWALSPLEMTRFITAVVSSAVGMALRPSTWTGTVRTVLVRQIYFTGVGALPITCVAGVVVGVSVIAQSGIWLAQLDQSALFGPLISNVVIQNIAPLLVNLLVIGRSGTAMATELANMAVHHEIEVVESQGVDPFKYIVVPRVVATGVSVFCLTVLFVASALIGGYLLGVTMQIPALGGGQFADRVFLSVPPAHLVQFLAKTIIPGLLTGAICCVYGLRVELVLTAVPQAATRAAVASVWALFAVLVVSSLFLLI